MLCRCGGGQGANVRLGDHRAPIALKLDEWYFESWFNGTGQQVVNNNNGHDGRPTKANVANPEAVEILTKFKDMRDDGLLQAFSDTDGQINQFLALASQQSSITVETSTAASTIKAFLGGTLAEAPAGAAEEVETAELIPRAAPLPGLKEPGKVRVSGGAYYMVKGSKSSPTPPEQIAAAWDFFQYMSHPENVADLHMQGSYLPVISPAQDDPRLQTFWKDDLAGRMLVVAREQLAEIDPENPGPLMGPYPEYVDAMLQALDNAILLDKDPAQACPPGGSVPWGEPTDAPDRATSQTSASRLHPGAASHLAKALRAPKPDST